MKVSSPSVHPNFCSVYSKEVLRRFVENPIQARLDKMKNWKCIYFSCFVLFLRAEHRAGWFSSNAVSFCFVGVSASSSRAWMRILLLLFAVLPERNETSDERVALFVVTPVPLHQLVQSINNAWDSVLIYGVLFRDRNLIPKNTFLWFHPFCILF